MSGEAVKGIRDGYISLQIRNGGQYDMSDHGKKMVAPIVITAIVVLYYVAYFALIAYVLDGAFRVLFGIIPAVLAAVMIYVCIQRINEIKGGEEDDIGKY